MSPLLFLSAVYFLLLVLLSLLLLSQSPQYFIKLSSISFCPRLFLCLSGASLCLQLCLAGCQLLIHPGSILAMMAAYGLCQTEYNKQEIRFQASWLVFVKRKRNDSSPFWLYRSRLKGVRLLIRGKLLFNCDAQSC